MSEEKTRIRTKPFMDANGMMHVPHGWTEKKPNYWRRFNKPLLWFMLGTVTGFCLFPIAIYWITKV